MNTKSEYFKAFPKYEDVFYDDIENHKKYFLPICSVNLKFIDPNRDEWFHFITVKEVNTCLGENTSYFHTDYSKEDTFGFNIIDGKYKFDSSWSYFAYSQKNKSENEFNILLTIYSKLKDFKNREELKNYINSLTNNKVFEEDVLNIYSKNQENENILKGEIQKLQNKYFKAYSSELDITYKESEKSFNAGKEFYDKYGAIFNYTLNLESLEELEKAPKSTENPPDFFGFIDDIKHQSNHNKELMSEFNISLEEMNLFDDDNISIPLDYYDEVFEYIGKLTGFYFQKGGANSIFLFHNSEFKKAVISLGY